MTGKTGNNRHTGRCALVHDLLPLYVEGLVSEESAREIEAHLAQCGRCRETLDAMREEAAMTLRETPPPERAVRFLKRQKRHTQVVAGVLLGIFAMLCVMFIGFINLVPFTIPQEYVQVEVYQHDDDLFRIVVRLAGKFADVNPTSMSLYYGDDEGNSFVPPADTTQEWDLADYDNYIIHYQYTLASLWFSDGSTGPRYGQDTRPGGTRMHADFTLNMAEVERVCYKDGGLVVKWQRGDELPPDPLNLPYFEQLDEAA